MTRTEVAELLRAKDRFLVITHIRPDGDTLGSASALCHALRRIGKTAYMFDNKGVTEKYVPFVAPYIAPEDFAPDFIVSVDTADTGLIPKNFGGEVDLSIDHHGTNSFYAKQTYVEPHKASCGEILLEVIKETCGGIDKDEATLLYMAISTDTGCFVYANTKADTHEAAAETIRAGAEMARINKLMFRSVRRQRIMLEALAYSGLRSYMDNKINIVAITLEMMEKSGATEDDCDDIASLPGRVAGSIASFTIRELTPGHCKISARCSDVMDVSKICGKYGGGGHKMASGCELDMTPDECAELMRKEAEMALS